MPKSALAQETYYHATLLVTRTEGRKSLDVAVGVGEQHVRVGVKPRLASRLTDTPPEGDQGVIGRPRTDQEGRLGNGTLLALYKPVGELGRKPGLHALGELVKVDQENALLHLRVHPNEQQGGLHKPFRLPLVASRELLAGLPEPGGGVEVWGELKPRTGRLVVTRAQAVPLPPKRVVATTAAG